MGGNVYAKSEHFWKYTPNMYPLGTLFQIYK